MKKLWKLRKKVKFCYVVCYVIADLLVYQRRVVEFLRQDDIIQVIASRYDGAISDELR